MTQKLNFTIGPVMMHQYTKEIGMLDNPYFRNKEFSSIMLQNQKNFLNTLRAPEGYNAIFMTGSGTLAMEAVVHSLLNDNDISLIVNGGSFGQRFCDLLNLYGMKYHEIKLDFGKCLREEDLIKYAELGISKLFLNLHETSSGVLYDLPMIFEFCRINNIMLVVDAISAYIADEIDLTKTPVDVLITGSQKALALPPGLSLIALSNKAQKVIEGNSLSRTSLYLDLHDSLKNMERGQTPFTPAVGILLQLHNRLFKLIDGGIDEERRIIRNRAEDFRVAMEEINLDLVSESKSNALTTIKVSEDVSAKKIVTILSEEYNMWVTPSGGLLEDKIFRVGHIGNIDENDQKKLISALKELNERGLLK